MAVSMTTLCGNPSTLIIQSVFQLKVFGTEKMDIVYVWLRVRLTLKNEIYTEKRIWTRSR